MPDLSTYTWVEVATTSAPDARVGAAMVWAGDRVILFGGRTLAPGVVDFDDTWEFVGDWNQLSPATTPPARIGAVMVWDPVGERVVMHGGGSHTPPNTPLEDTWEYIVGGDWTLLEASGPKNNGFNVSPNSGVWDIANDRLLYNLGWDPSGVGTEMQLWEYPTGGPWNQLSPSPAMELDVTSGSPDPDPQAIWSQAAAWDPDAEVMYVQGGSWTTDRTNNATWAYDGTGFTQVSGEGAGGSPPGIHRDGSEMVWAGDRVFLWGGDLATIGTLGQSPDDGNYWTQDGQWTQIYPAGNPAARYGHSMVWTGTCAIVFGGNSGTTSNVFMDDTWEFCGDEPVAEIASIRHTFGLGG